MASFPFARRYLGHRSFFLFLRVLRCFSSPRSLRTAYVFSCGYLSITLSEFPHSDICGSSDICSYPQLFAACHVLLRLPVPRHPPYALSFLTFFSPYMRIYMVFWFFSVEIVDSPSLIFSLSAISSDCGISRFLLLCLFLACYSVLLVLPTNLSVCYGGLGRTRTSDLTLIRRAL